MQLGKTAEEYKQMLADKGVPIQTALTLKDARGYCPLHLAAEALDIGLATFCLENGANINEKAGDRTPLDLTICRLGKIYEDTLIKMPQMIELLCTHGVEINTFVIYSFGHGIKHYPTDSPARAMLDKCLGLLKDQHKTSRLKLLG